MKRSSLILLLLALLCVFITAGCTSNEAQTPASSAPTTLPTTQPTIPTVPATTPTTVPAVCPHSFGDWVIIKEATCAQEGQQTRVCTLCQDVEYQTIAKTQEHTVVIDAAVAPTCTTDGKTEGKHCSVCDTTLVPQEIVKAKGHNEIIIQGVAVTCTENGLTDGKYCDVCDTTLVAQEVISAPGHEYYRHEEIPPTETTEGYTLHSCACGDVYKDDFVPALASLGLEFTLANNPVIGDYYVLSGIGTCKDTHIIVPSHVNGRPVKTIGKNALSNVEFVVSVTLPEEVNIIENGAFFDCDSLQKVTMTGVTRINKHAFARCFNLVDIVLPDSLDLIGVSAFALCTSLEKIVIPYETEQVKAYAFEYCENLTIYCEIDDIPFGWSEDWNVRANNKGIVWNHREPGDSRHVHFFSTWSLYSPETVGQGKTMRRVCWSCGCEEFYTYPKLTVYYGVSTDDNLTDAAGLTSKITTTKDVTLIVTAGVGEYIYHYSPEYFGECIFIVGGWQGGFTYLGVHTVNGVEYHVYRSDYPNLGKIKYNVQ